MDEDQKQQGQKKEETPSQDNLVTDTDKITFAEEKEDYGINDKKSINVTIVSVIAVVVIIAIIASIPYIYNPEPKISTGLVKINSPHPSAEKAKEYIYNNIEFKREGDFWYADLKTGNTIYSAEFYYGPREIENIQIAGENVFGTAFQNEKLYVTFDPNESKYSRSENNESTMKFVALAVGQIDTHFIKTFKKQIIAACTNEEAPACFGRPIINCENATDTAVILVKEAAKPKITFAGNCTIVEGKEWDLIKAAENMVMRAYAIIG
ncbi:hypothetical protein J4206_05105 [Candidatus Woesearchaeota archaeon]|nr:hypothetical protein [Candidatus Woesearchaeota archaeon]